MQSRIVQTALALCALVVSIPVFASAQRTFVSTSGVNNPACSLVAPCRDFATAITATNPGGEVIVLDSGGYGKVTITQSVSIIAAPGVYAGISVFPVDDGVTVAAGASDKVVLRGLTINGQGGNRGIRVTSGGLVHIEYCTVANMGFSGIQIDADSHVYVSHSIVRNNGGATGYGLGVAGGAHVYVDDSQFAGNYMWGIAVGQGRLNANRIVVQGSAQGISAGSGASVTVADSVLSENGMAGAWAASSGSATAPVEMNLIRTTSTNNILYGFALTWESGGGVSTMLVSDSAAVANRDAGVHVSGAGATAIVSGSTLAGNVGADLYNSGGTLRSSANNTLTGRGAADIVGTITSNPLK